MHFISIFYHTKNTCIKNNVILSYVCLKVVVLKRCTIGVQAKKTERAKISPTSSKFVQILAIEWFVDIYLL
jgi:hypothetical protein